MLKNVIAGPAVALALLAWTGSLPAAAQEAPSRIGYVATERLYTESKLAQAAESRIEAEFAGRQKENAELLARLKSLSERFNADASKLVEPERARRARALMDLDKQLQRKERAYRDDLFQRTSEERARIAQKAYLLIGQLAEQEQLDVVVREALWHSKRIDITDTILKRLDQ